VLQWLDNGPFRALSERALASLARSIQQMEVSRVEFNAIFLRL
jgi:hypothetical protein